MNAAASVFNVGIALRAAAQAGSKRLRRAVRKPSGPVDLFLCVVDHFEPQVGQPTAALARMRLEDWLHRYPQIAGRHRDADGRSPAHSFFYPYDEYDEWEFRRLTALCADGWGEIDLHLHHKDDTSDSLRRKFQDAVHLYHDHGVLPVWPDGRPAFGFIHGNWALDNSRCENGHNFCGVNNELTLLAEQGCYADFTFPAWQHTAQPRQINSIYYALDDPSKPKSYDRGTPVRTGVPGSGTLLLVEGPLVPFITGEGKRRRVAMDDSDLAFCRRYAPERLDRWVRAGIQVEGCPDRIFIKLHCHGAADQNREALLGNDFEALFSDAEARYNDGTNFRLHYVTAREMYNVVKATEAEAHLSIPVARDWILPRPTYQAKTAKSRNHGSVPATAASW